MEFKKKNNDKLNNRIMILIIILLIIFCIGGIYLVIGEPIYKYIVNQKNMANYTLKTINNEIKEAPNIKSLKFKKEYNNSIYAAILIKSVSQMENPIDNDIYNNVNIYNPLVLNVFKAGNQMSQDAKIKDKLTQSLRYKMISNMENYINSGNIKLNTNEIMKTVGVTDLNDVFVSVKLVDNPNNDIPNRVYYINPQKALLNDIQIPKYTGGKSLEIVFLNKNAVSRCLNKANHNAGESKYELSSENIDNFDILMAMIWMNNQQYSPLYYTTTPLYSGNDGWELMSNSYRNKKMNNINNEEETNLNNTTNNEEVNNNNNSNQSSQSSVEEEAENNNSNNSSNISNSNEEESNNTSNSSSVEEDSESNNSSSSNINSDDDENNNSSNSSSIEESSGSNSSSSSSISSDDDDSSSSSFSSCSDDDD